MKYKTLGRTGLKVSVVGLGMGPSALGRDIKEDQAKALVDTALDAGVNLFDTSDAYNAGGSEEVLGKVLKGRRQKAIIETKVGMAMSDHPNDVGLSRTHIMEAVEASLRDPQRVGVLPEVEGANEPLDPCCAPPPVDRAA